MGSGFFGFFSCSLICSLFLRVVLQAFMDLMIAKIFTVQLFKFSSMTEKETCILII